MKTKFFNGIVITVMVLSLLALTPATPAHAASLTVNTLADENDHSCMDGDCSLRDALEVANNGDTISFSVTGTISLSIGKLNILDNLTITGPGNDLLTINGNAASQIFDINNNKVVVITGLTLTNGFAQNCGGAVYARAGSHVTLDNMVMSNNQALKNGGGDNVDGGAACIFDGGSLSISNSTLNNNTAWRDGGAIVVYYASLTLSNVTLSGNKAQGYSSGTSGGAISIFSDQALSSSAFLSQVTITNNTSTYSGGGLYIKDYADVTIQDSLIQGNSVTGYLPLNAGDGGGLSVGSNTTIQIVNSIIDNNSAEYKGGGIGSYGANITIRDSLISNNHAEDGSNGYGGGIYTVDDSGSNGALTLENTTVSGNSALVGGGIFLQDSSLSLRNATITDNSAAYTGGMELQYPDSLTMVNTLVANNSSLLSDYEDCSSYNPLSSLGHNLIEAGPDCITPAAGDILGVDPKLNPLADNGGSSRTHSLQIGSPALDSGNNASCLATDQRGTSRPQDGDNNSTSICDIGAFEKVYAAPTATFADVPVNYWSWQYIEGIYMAGVTGGCNSNPLNYCPTSPVTRAQMAVFLLKSLHGGSYTPPPVGPGTGFNDVANDYWAAGWIKQLAAEGITSGCGNGNYCPENTVTRDQMAVFLLKAKYGTAYIPPAVGAGTGFSDVPGDYWAAAWIKQLAAEAITGGCGGGLYCPANPVTRDQMAVFLQRTFGLPMP